MAFTVHPLTFSDTDRGLALDRTWLSTARESLTPTADMIREVDIGHGFLLGGLRGSDKTSLLKKVAFHFNTQAAIVALGPLSLQMVAQSGLHSLGSQLRDWLRDNKILLPNTLSSSLQPTHADSLDAWLPFLDRLISQRNANTLLLLLDDLDSVPREDRVTILQDIQNSSWAKTATRTVLGCAGNLLEDEISLIPVGETYDNHPAPIGRPPGSRAYYYYGEYASDEEVQIKLKKYCAVELLNAMIINLGMVPPPGKKAGKDGGTESTRRIKSPAPGKPPGRPPGKPGKLLGGGKPKAAGKPRDEAAIKEEVEATVYAPQQASPGNSFLVQVFADLPGRAPALEEIAKKAEPEAEMRVGTTLPEKIQRGDKLTFKLDMPGLQIDKPAKSCIWRGKRELVQFNVIVPKKFKPGKIIGTVEMWGNSVPIGDLSFSFKIVSETAAVVSETPTVGKMKQYKQVFVSYASPDRTEVKKFTLTWDSFGVNYFMDKRNLKSGDEWKKVIPQEIDKSDAFVLFWSQAASESKWVKPEFLYALSRQKPKTNEAPRIYPFRIEALPACPEPPPELKDFHFEDLFP